MAPVILLIQESVPSSTYPTNAWMMSIIIMSGWNKYENILPELTPAVVASEAGNFCPNIISPYRTTGTRKKDIWICQATGFSPSPPAMKYESNPPIIKPPGHPACRMFR